MKCFYLANNFLFKPNTSRQKANFRRHWIGPYKALANNDVFITS